VAKKSKNYVQKSHFIFHDSKVIYEKVDWGKVNDFVKVHNYNLSTIFIEENLITYVNYYFTKWTRKGFLATRENSLPCRVND
jgi:hypothetical protein